MLQKSKTEFRPHIRIRSTLSHSVFLLRPKHTARICRNPARKFCGATKRAKTGTNCDNHLPKASHRLPNRPLDTEPEFPKRYLSRGKIPGRKTRNNRHTGKTEYPHLSLSTIGNVPDTGFCLTKRGLAHMCARPRPLRQAGKELISDDRSWCSRRSLRRPALLRYGAAGCTWPYGRNGSSNRS